MVFSKKSNTKKNAGKRLTRRGGKKLKKTSKKRGYKKTKGGLFDVFKRDPKGVMLPKYRAPELYDDVKKIITSPDSKVNNNVQRLVKTKKTNRQSNSPLDKGTYGPLNCNSYNCNEEAILLTKEEVKMFEDNNIKKIYEQISIPYGSSVNVYHVKYNPDTNKIVKNENFDAEVAAAETNAAKTKAALEAEVHRKEVEDAEAAEAYRQQLQKNNEEFFKNQEAERKAKLDAMSEEERKAFLEEEARIKRLEEAAEAQKTETNEANANLRALDKAAAAAKAAAAKPAKKRTHSLAGVGVH